MTWLKAVGESCHMHGAHCLGCELILVMTIGRLIWTQSYFAILSSWQLEGEWETVLLATVVKKKGVAIDLLAQSFYCRRLLERKEGRNHIIP